MQSDEIICYCDNVTRGEIEQACADGAKTLADVRRMTGACTSCKCEEMSPKHKCCAGDIARAMTEWRAANA